MKEFSFLIAALSASRVVYSAPVAAQVGTTYFFTFGNSYTSTGFDASSTQPSATNPMGNPALGQGTSSGGLNWVGYVTTILNTSLVLNYDLAVSGACINNSIVGAPVPDLISQVQSTFKPIYAGKPDSSPWTAADGVFAFWIGINDIGNSYRTINRNTTVPILLDSYFDLVDQVYGSGARRFLFLTVPPTTRSPMISLKDSDIHAAYVSLYNQQLTMRINKFKQAHPDATVVEYDVWVFMTAVLDNPYAYGFEGATCIGAGCVWWDTYHPTVAFHELMAKAMVPKLRTFQTGW